MIPATITPLPARGDLANVWMSRGGWRSALGSPVTRMTATGIRQNEMRMVVTPKISKLAGGKIAMIGCPAPMETM
jgi:hypothetical protein